jgi:hypothetical protein
MATLAKWLDGVAAKVIIACSAKVTDASASLHQGFGQNIQHVEVRGDYADDGWLVELCQRFDVSRIASTAESDIMRAASTREFLALPGQSVASAVCYRDKYVMKSVASAHGVRTPAIALASSASDIAEFAERVGFPVIAKPRDAAACQGIIVIHDSTELSQRTSVLDRTLASGNYVLEEWIGLPLFHVDGLIRGGKVQHSWPSMYQYPNLATMRSAAPCMSGMLSADDPRWGPLQDSAAAVVRALPATPDTTALHAEFFCGHDAVPVFCEIACRPGGAGVVEVYERAFGENLYRRAILGQIGVPDSAAIAPRVPAGFFGWAYFPPRDAVLRQLPRAEDLPGAVWCSVDGTVGQAYGKISAPLENLAKAVIGVDPADVAASLSEVERWWQEGSVWEEYNRPGSAQHAELGR